jgi:hypothetical protein
MTTTCKNCNQKFKGHYCNNCGQSANTKEISMIYLWHEIEHGILHIDKGILYTTKELFTRPGNSIKEFIDGKRVKHFKPLAYIFILSSLYAVLAHYFKIGIYVNEITTKIPNIDKQKGLEVVQMILDIFYWFRNHYANTTIIFLPSFSLASYLAFRNSNYNYLKHLVLNAYLAGQRTVVFILFLPFFAIIKNKEAISILQNVETVIWISLMTWTFFQLFKTNKLLKNIKLTLTAFIYLFIQVIIVVIVLGVSIVVAFS